MGYRSKTGSSGYSSPNPVLNAQAWQRPLTSNAVGAQGNGSYSSKPACFICGGPQAGQKREGCRPTSCFPLWSPASRFVTGSRFSSSRRFAERMSRFPCPAHPRSLSLFSLRWCLQHLSLSSLSSIPATWATAWAGKPFEPKLSLCLHPELSLVASLHLLPHSRKPLGAFTGSLRSQRIPEGQQKAQRPWDKDLPLLSWWLAPDP